MSRRVYVASSWRNEKYERVIEAIQHDFHQVHNWRNPTSAFKWTQVGLQKRVTEGGLECEQSMHTIREALLTNPRCAQGFLADMRGLEWADTVVLLHPSGRSAHLEFGYAMGRGKFGIVFLNEGDAPDLMTLMGHEYVTDIRELLMILNGTRKGFG